MNLAQNGLTSCRQTQAALPTCVVKDLWFSRRHEKLLLLSKQKARTHTSKQASKQSKAKQGKAKQNTQSKHSKTHAETSNAKHKQCNQGSERAKLVAMAA